MSSSSSSSIPIEDYDKAHVAPMTWAFISVTNVLLMTLFVLVVWRRNVQPLKAHSPPLIMLGLLAHFILMNFVNLRFAVGRATYPCFLYTQNFVMTVPLIALPNTLRLWRVYFVLKLNKDKELASLRSGNADNKIRKNLLRWRMLASNRFLVGVIGMVALLHCVIYGALLGVNQSLASAKGCYGGVTLFIFVLVQALFFLLLNIVLVGLTLRVREVWGIRKSVFVSASMWIILTILFFILTITPPFDNGTDRYFPTGYILVLACVLDMLVTALYPVVASFKDIKKKKYRLLGTPKGGLEKLEVEQDAALLVEILNDEFARGYFKKFCVQAFCPENVIFWEDIRLQYEKEPSEEKRHELAMDIIEKYMKFSSELCLNISSPQDSEERIQSAIKTNGATQDVFSSVLLEVEQNMMDPLRRFTVSPMFEKIAEHKKAIADTGFSTEEEENSIIVLSARGGRKESLRDLTAALETEMKTTNTTEN